MRFIVQTSAKLMFLREKFSRVQSNASRTSKNGWSLPSFEPYLQLNWFQGFYDVTKKRKLFLRLLLTYSRLFVLPHLLDFDIQHSPPLGSGILTGFPFDLIEYLYMCINILRSEPAFARILGLTDPCPKAVHMEPFSTSVYKVLIWIVATTTKICTNDCSSQTHVLAFDATISTFLLVMT